LEVAVEAGLLGLGAFLALTGTIVQRSWQRIFVGIKQPSPRTFLILGIVAGMAGTMAQGLVDTLWFRPQVQMLWWLSVALVFSAFNAYDSPSSS
jgi:putative inorganic carbon (HCO3(-)) transporter